MIRSYEPQDKNQLLEIFRLNTPKHFNPNEVHDFDEYLNQHAATYLTIEHNGKIVGGAGYHVQTESKSGHITWIFFRPDATGIGLGRSVMQHCFNILAADQIVNKLVVTTSQLAFRFFEKFGFTLLKTEKDHWGPGLDLYLMEKTI